MRFLGLVVDRLLSEVYVRQLRRIGVDVHPTVRLIGKPIVSLSPNSTLSIARDVRLVSRARRTALAVAHPVTLRTLMPGAEIVIGAGTGISGGSICAAKSVQIGKNCLIGADCVVVDTDFHPLDPSRRSSAPTPEPSSRDCVWIGDDVFLGVRSVVLKGVHLASGSVVGAQSVVTKTVASRSIVAGAPAMHVRDI